MSPSGDLIATGDSSGTVRVGRRDGSEPHLHTLPREALLAKLDSLTNVRVVAEVSSPSGYKVDLAPFPGGKRVPEW
jgi:hypothetical protein